MLPVHKWYTVIDGPISGFVFVKPQTFSSTTFMAMAKYLHGIFHVVNLLNQ